MNTDRFNNLRRRLLTPGRSLLLPMLILAAGIHVALLALPLPSTEAIKEAEDKRNPVTVNQIPTEQPEQAASSPTGAVDVPDMAANPPSASATSADDSATAGDTAGDTSASDSSAASRGSDSDSTASSAMTSAPAKPPSSKAATATNTAAGSDSTSDTTGSIAVENAANSEATQSTTSEAASSAATAPTSTNVASSPFADFPHFQPSEADCFGLGFGENCRIVEGQDLTQVAEFFKQELAAKEFTTTVVTDTADRKVFRVAKGDQTMFLNLWKGKNNISYLLSKVILKQPPEEIKVEAKQ